MPASRIWKRLSDPYTLAKGILISAAAYLTFVIILPSTLSTWRDVHTVSTLNVTPTTRAQLVDTLADKVARRYLDEKKARRSRPRCARPNVMANTMASALPVSLRA